MKKKGSIRQLVQRLKTVWLLKCSRFHRRQTKESQRVLNRCACGDVVYCEMPLKDWELSGVREGHRCRPYLVLKVNRRGIIGIPASHKEPDNPNRLRWWALRPRFYDSFEHFGEQRESTVCSWFDLSRPVALPAIKLLSWSRSLDSDDFAYVTRLLAIRQADPSVIPRPGDILRTADGWALVTREAEDRLYLTVLEKGPFDLFNITADNCQLWLKGAEEYSIASAEAGIVSGFLYPSELQKVKQRMKEIKARQKKKEQSRQKKKKSSFALPNHSMDFQMIPGTLLEDPFQDRRVFYLCSGKRCAMVVEEESWMEQKSRLVNMPKCLGYKPVEITDPQTMDEIFTDLTSWKSTPEMHRFVQQVKEQYDREWKNLEAREAPASLIA
ncbi:hypothetical protein [uncultured Faecalibaculum sp.]|uniref:hypothetical protein n=1 Tax=uncultured Faecalibaculum sp. TaxID=1729681 RepID=UPI0025F5C9D1|nr:hypothetical protein [uncultured Faecalibaculum sp.]